MTAGVNTLIPHMQDADGVSWLTGANYYWFFVGLMLVATLGFLLVARTFPAREPHLDAAAAA